MIRVKLCVSAALEDYIDIGLCPVLDIKNKPKKLENLNWFS